MSMLCLLTVSLMAPPADLAIVPKDAIAVVHLNAKEFWSSEMMSGLRTTVDKAGPKALAAFRDGFYPPPESISRITLFGIAPGAESSIDVIGIISFDKPFDIAKVKQVNCENAAKDTNVVPLKGQPIEIHMPDDKHIVVGGLKTVTNFLKREAGDAKPIIAKAIEKMTAGSTLVAAGDLAMFPPGARRIPDAPPGTDEVLKANNVLLTIDMKSDIKIRLAAGYANATAARNAEAGLRKLIGIGLAEMDKMKSDVEAQLYDKKGPRPINDLPASAAALYGLGSVNQINDMAKNLPIKQNDTSLEIEVVVPKEYTNVVGTYAVAVGLLLPAVQKVRESAAMMNGSNQLKMIGLTIFNYESSYGIFPSISNQAGYPKNAPKDPKKRLSWRVMILPYLEQDPLYRQFKLDEPWDSDHNKKLIPLMPKIYQHAGVDAGEGKTFYKSFSGENCFMGKSALKMTSITDGLSNTLMVVAAGDPVIWTAPDDFEVDFKKDPPDLTKPFGAKTPTLFCDGTVRMIDFSKLSKQTIKNLIQINDGNVIDLGK